MDLCKEVRRESLERERVNALVDTIKTCYMMYCEKQKRFRVSRDREHIPHVPYIIRKRCIACERIACDRYNTCLVVVLKEELKEDLLEFYRAWQHAGSLEGTLRACNRKYGGYGTEE